MRIKSAVPAKPPRRSGVFHVKRLFAICLALLMLTGCAPAPAQALPTAERTFFAMDTVMTLRLYEGGDETLLEQAEARVKELEGQLSVTNPGSEIYALNHTGAAELSLEQGALLEAALDLCGRTDGALDISIYPVLRAWGFTTGEYAVPGGEAIAALLPLVDYTKIRVDLDLPERARVTLPDGMEIDLGSVAKGYTGDVLAALLMENGAVSAMLDLGGNIQAVGAKPDGSPWRVGIRDPEGDGNVGIVEIIDRAVVTSGGYERYFEEDGVRYWHILDPKTGAPARSGLASVTVVDDSGVLCDALSTALFVMGLDGAIGLWREYQDFEAVFVSEDGSVTITAGLENSFTLSQTNRTLTVVRP